MDAKEATRGHACGARGAGRHHLEMSEMTHCSSSSESCWWAHDKRNAPGIIGFLLLFVTLESRARLRAETKPPSNPNDRSFTEISI